MSKKGELGFEIIVGIIAIIILVSAVPFIIGSLTTGSGLLPGAQSNVEGASYIIYKDDFGATCAKNGTSSNIDLRSYNSTIVINYALDNNLNGGTIAFRSGIYDIWNLTIPSDVNLIGEGKGKYNDEQLTILNAIGNVNGITIKSSTMPHSGGGIYNLRLVGNYIGLNGIELSLGLTYNIQNIAISDFKGDAIHIEGGVDISIDGCILLNNQGKGVNASYTDGYGSYAVIISRTTFMNNTAGNIFCTEGTYLISNCVFENQYDSDHITIKRPKSSITTTAQIIGCLFAGTGYYPVENDAVNISGANNVLIEGCTFNVARTCINTTVNCDVLTVQGCQFQYWIEWAVDIRSNHTLISNNQLIWTHDNGGGVKNSHDYQCQILNNQFICHNKNQYPAIYDTGAMCMINNNYIVDSNVTAILVTGTMSSVNGNNIEMSYSHAIMITGYECQVEGNYIFDADRLNRSSYDGIILTNGASKTKVSMNIIVGYAHTRYGINILSSCSNATISENLISNCLSAAINDSGTSTVMRSNDV